METQVSLSEATSVRLAEVIGALSVATDLGMGHPLEFALCSCVLSVRLAEELQFSEEERRSVYYQALLRYVGCNAETHMLAALVGDELAMRREFARVNNGSQLDVVRLISRYLREAHPGGSPLQLVRSMTLGIMEMSQVSKEIFAGHCEVAQRLAERLGFSGEVVEGLGQLYERWDGKGLPYGIKGESITPAVRVVTLAQDAVTFYRLGGVAEALDMALARRGGAYDPAIVDRFRERSGVLFDGFDQESAWETVLDLEPGERIRLTAERLDQACEAIADFTDLKSPFTLGHSHGVARLASAAAQRRGLPGSDIDAVRRAALVHDIGRVGVSAGIWTKAGPLTGREWEQVRLHPYYTERVLARPGLLSRLGTLASYHHERLDSSGYHRGVGAASLTPAARILAAADVYQAMTEDRPHRPARAADEAVREIRREVANGRLDGAVVDAVLEAAGHRGAGQRSSVASGLSQREIEVLRLVARGLSIKQIADRLFISRKTVDNHIQHIYAKTGVSTRAGATLFAIEQQLLDGSTD